MEKIKSTIAICSRSFSNNYELTNLIREKYTNVILNESGQTLKGQELQKFLYPADKAIIGIEEISGELLADLPNLKLISKYGVGLNNIDLNSVKQRGILLGFTPGPNKQSVAELALTLILISLRKIPRSLDDIRNKIWSQQKGRELFNKTVGIVGYGNIGKALAKLLTPFNCNILFFDKFEENQNSAVKAELNFLLNKSDIVSIHLPLNQDTRYLFDKKTLSLMKEDVVIVNTSRGGIINENDLHIFLERNDRAFAALDVFENEPSFDNPLLSLKNFYATSHLGSLTDEGILSMGKNAIDNLERGKKLVDV